MKPETKDAIKQTLIGAAWAAVAVCIAFAVIMTYIQITQLQKMM